MIFKSDLSKLITPMPTDENVLYTPLDKEWNSIMDKKRLIKGLATGLLGASLAFGAFYPSQSHASTIKAGLADHDMIENDVFDIYQHVVDNYKPIDYDYIERCSTHPKMHCKGSRYISPLFENVSAVILGTDFDIDNYEDFHDTLLMTLDQYYRAYTDLTSPKDSKIYNENWLLDENGVMVDQSDRHKRIFNYLLLKLYFLSSPKYFYDNSNMEVWDKGFISNHYKSTSFYIDTHIDRDTNGHFDAGYIKKMVDNSGIEKTPDEIEKEPLIAVPLHEPLALYNVHRAGRPFLGLNKRHRPVEEMDYAYMTHTQTSHFQTVDDTPRNAIRAVNGMLRYNNNDIESPKFKMDSVYLFNRYPVSIMELLKDGANPLDRKGVSAWGDLKINNLVFPAFLNIGLGNDVKVSGNMLFVFPSQKTNQVIAPDNGTAIIRGIEDNREILIRKRYVANYLVTNPDVISDVSVKRECNYENLSKDSGIFIIDNKNTCYKK